MAKEPTPEDVLRAIFDAISTYNVRANQIVPITGVQIKVMKAGFTAEEFENALNNMLQDGLITVEQTNVFLKLTEAGFALM